MKSPGEPTVSPDTYAKERNGDKMANKRKTLLWAMVAAASSAGLTALVAGGIAAVKNTKKRRALRAVRTAGEVLSSLGSAVTGMAK